MNYINDLIFRSRFSKWIAGMYWMILAFLIIMMIGIPLVITMTLMEKSLYVFIFCCTSIIFIYLIWKAYTMKFIISKNQIIIYGLLQKITIDISNVETIQKFPIPFGLRLFGVICLGGAYFFLGIRKTSVSMSNFDDGVLLTTKQKENYLITPETPKIFIKIILKIKKE